MHCIRSAEMALVQLTKEGVSCVIQPGRLRDTGGIVLGLEWQWATTRRSETPKPEK